MPKTTFSPELKQLCKLMAKAGLKAMAGPDQDAIATCFMDTKRIKGGHGGSRINAKTIDELEKQLRSLHSHCGAVYSLSYTECEFSVSAKVVFSRFILEYLKNNYRVVMVDTDNDLLDECTQNKVKEFLERNRKLYGYNRKAKIVVLPSYLIHMLFLSVTSASISALFIHGLIFSVAYYALYRQHANKANPRTASLTMFYDIALIAGVMLIFINPLAMAVSLGANLILLSINFLRNCFVENAMKQYDASISLSTDEIESMQAGLASQRSFLPHWGLPTWKCSKAYYVGLYNSQERVEEIAQQTNHRSAPSP